MYHTGQARKVVRTQTALKMCGERCPPLSVKGEMKKREELYKLTCDKIHFDSVLTQGRESRNRRTQGFLRKADRKTDRVRQGWL